MPNSKGFPHLNLGESMPSPKLVPTVSSIKLCLAQLIPNLNLNKTMPVKLCLTMPNLTLTSVNYSVQITNQNQGATFIDAQKETNACNDAIIRADHKHAFLVDYFIPKQVVWLND